MGGAERERGRKRGEEREEHGVLRQLDMSGGGEESVSYACAGTFVVRIRVRLSAQGAAC